MHILTHSPFFLTSPALPQTLKKKKKKINLAVTEFDPTSYFLHTAPLKATHTNDIIC